MQEAVMLHRYGHFGYYIYIGSREVTVVLRKVLYNHTNRSHHHMRSAAKAWQNRQAHLQTQCGDTSQPVRMWFPHLPIMLPSFHNRKL